MVHSWDDGHPTTWPDTKADLPHTANPGSSFTPTLGGPTQLSCLWSCPFWLLPVPLQPWPTPGQSPGPSRSQPGPGVPLPPQHTSACSSIHGLPTFRLPAPPNMTVLRAEPVPHLLHPGTTLACSIADEQGPKLWSQSWASIQHYDPGQVTTSPSRSFLGSKIGLKRLPQLLGGENFAPRAAEICGSDAGGSLEHCEPSPQQDNKMPSPSRSPEIWNVPGMLQAATELQCVDGRAIWGPRPGGSP